MKTYTITVNGNVYEVCVEEGAGAVEAPAVAVAPQAAPKAAPKPAAQAAPKAAPKPAASGAQGDVKVTAPMPGKILKVVASAGASVKKGDVLVVLEAMKMENDIVAPQDGTVVSVNVSAGQNVEPGEVLATM